MRDHNDEVLASDNAAMMVITVNRPQAINAVTTAVTHGFADCLDALDARADPLVGIVTGAGGIFCAGMDLKGFLAGEVPTVEGRGFARGCASELSRSGWSTGSFRRHRTGDGDRTCQDHRAELATRGPNQYAGHPRAVGMAGR